MTTNIPSVMETIVNIEKLITCFILLPLDIILYHSGKDLDGNQLNTVEDLGKALESQRNSRISEYTDTTNMDGSASISSSDQQEYNHDAGWVKCDSPYKDSLSGKDRQISR